jgi:hypothetical protein
MPGVANIHMFFMLRHRLRSWGPSRPTTRAVIAIRHACPPDRDRRGARCAWRRRLAPGALERSGTQVGDRVRLEAIPLAH